MSHPLARPRRLVATAVATAVVAATSVLPGAALPSAEAATTEKAATGAAWHGLWASSDTAEKEVVLDELADHGLTWVRLDIGWASVQPDGPDGYDPNAVQDVREAATMARERGMQVLGMFWLTPAWAGPDKQQAPRDADDYASALAGLVEAVPEVSAWEVWNEPNRESFFASTDPATYARLLSTAHDAVKEVAPEATVVMGGTAYNDAAWIEEALAAGAAGHYDVMATHPYGAPADQPPDAAADGTKYTFRHLDAVRGAMARHGDGDLPVWLTELGWSTHANTGGTEPWERGVSEAVQARYSARVLHVLSRDFPYVEVVIYYNAVDHETGTTSQYDNYGLMRDDLSPKPVLDALAAAKARLSGGG